MNDAGLFPMRQMPGVFNGEEARVRHTLQEPLATVKTHGFVLLSPDYQNRPWIFSHPNHLFTLIRFGIGNELRQTSASKPPILHLYAIPGGPIRKPIRMQKILHLLLRPVPFVNSCEK